MCDPPLIEAPCFLNRQVRLTDLLEYRGQRHLHTTQSVFCEKPFKKTENFGKKFQVVANLDPVRSASLCRIRIQSGPARIKDRRDPTFLT